MSIGEIVTLVITVVTALPAIVTAIIALVKIIKNKQWDTIKALADDAMKYVEEYSKAHPEMTSDDKLNMAVELVAQGCASLTGVKWDETLVENIKKYIKMCIGWFNEMGK